MNIWLVLFLGGLLTYAIRLSFILMFAKKDIPPWLERGLRFIPPAVLSAIIFPEIFMHTGKFEPSLANPRLVAGLLAALVAWRTRNALLTILVGMVTLLVFQQLM